MRFIEKNQKSYFFDRFIKILAYFIQKSKIRKKRIKRRLRFFLR